MAFYHLYNRGVAKTEIFREAADCMRFLSRYCEYAKSLRIETITYTLMPNHIHFVLGNVSREPDLTQLMRRLGTSYAMYFNRKYGRVGHLFQNRYRIKLVDKEYYLLRLSRYIHQNPMKLQRNCGSEPVVGVTINWPHIRKYRWGGYSAYVELIKVLRRRGLEKIFVDGNGVPIRFRYLLDLFGGGSDSQKAERYCQFVETEVVKCEKNAIRSVLLERE